MATMRMPVLALIHYLQSEALPDWVERFVVEHDFAMFRILDGLLPCFPMPGFSEYLHVGMNQVL